MNRSPLELTDAVVCGIDEAGRGPLAGPVTASAVILPPDFDTSRLNDSKKLTEKQREALYGEILSRAQVGVGMADEKEIDRLNILNATFLAMNRALEALGAVPDLTLVDGNRDPRLLLKGNPVPTRTVVHGDAVCACIAAASIIAKVTRDRLMKELALAYPQYGFEIHKGYPTAAHYQAVETFGISPVHRRSFFVKRPALLEIPYTEAGACPEGRKG